MHETNIPTSELRLKVGIGLESRKTRITMKGASNRSLSWVKILLNRD